MTNNTALRDRIAHYTLKRSEPPGIARLLSRITKTENGCWEWLGCIGHSGYGQIMINRRGLRTHRVTYEHFVGPIPAGLEIDHLCFNRACCNPDHLEAVTHAENSRRMGARRTHCPHGHEYTPENTWMSRNGNGLLVRECRSCNRDRSARYYQSRKNRDLLDERPGQTPGVGAATRAGTDGPGLSSSGAVEPAGAGHPAPLDSHPENNDPSARPARQRANGSSTQGA